jgi:hypothetical protein
MNGRLRDECGRLDVLINNDGVLLSTLTTGRATRDRKAVVGVWLLAPYSRRR